MAQPATVATLPLEQRKDETPEVTETEPPKPKNLRQKWASIRRAIRSIPKKGHNKAQDYGYMRAEDVSGDVGDMMADLNLSMPPVRIQVINERILEVRKADGSVRQDVLISIVVDYDIVDGDSDERMRVCGGGSGRDTGDKAFPKAMTCAKKYAITQALTMRVGDDAEDDSEHDKDTGSARVITGDPLYDQTPAPTRQPTDKATMDEKQTLITLANLKHGKAKGKAWCDGKLKALQLPNWGAVTAAHIALLTKELDDLPTLSDEDDIPF